MKKDTVRILLVEDQIMMRLATTTVIESIPNFELVGQASDGFEGLELARKLAPDVVLMDIGLPKIDGIEATLRIREIGINCKILMFTLRGGPEDVFSALKAGADGYIMKDASPETLVSAIEAVNQGAAWLDPQIARLVLSSINEGMAQTNAGGDKTKNKYGLTKRELEVLALIVDGLSNEEISDKLFVSLSTTKAHVHSILQKLYLNDRTQAAVRAIKEGLL